MKLVVLTGIPGSGSTTLLNKALEEVDYIHLNYGDIMTEIAIEEKIVDDRDALRKLSPDVQKEIKEKAESVAAGSTFLEISGKALGNIEILMPKELEQNKVSNYFLKLDNLITLHQRKIKNVLHKNTTINLFVR